MSEINWDERKSEAIKWFSNLRNDICAEFEKIETELKGTKHKNMPPAFFERKAWDRANTDEPNVSGSILKGGGEISLMRGRVFEKVGVNISTVHGTFAENFRAQIPGAVDSEGKFWAAGISLVAHMQSPLVPAVHMNTRMIVTSKGWFGGGMDLTPMLPNVENKEIFHDALKECCTHHAVADYDALKKWCDEYFYLPHRNEPRGDGGIFYDYFENDWQDDFDFTQDVGKTFLKTYPQIIRRTMNKDWTEEQRETQLIKRGRYVEYNLLYDRGTQFGLKTGGNTDAILMSLPPEVKWP